MTEKILLDVEGEEGVKEVVHERGNEGAMLLASLSWNDLQRLREATKRQYMRMYPTEHMTDREADRIIETLAPRTAEKLVKHLVDGKKGRVDL